MSASASEPSASRPRRGGRREVTAAFLAGVLMALLSIQFLLGTYLNLYVTIPPGGNLGAMDLGGLAVLILHILVGIMVIGTSLRMTFVAVRAHIGRQTALAAIAALGMIVAFLAGADFTFSSQGNAASFLMAFGFFLGMFCSALIVAGAQLPRPGPGSPPETASR